MQFFAFSSVQVPLIETLHSFSSHKKKDALQNVQLCVNVVQFDYHFTAILYLNVNIPTTVCSSRCKVICTRV